MVIGPWRAPGISSSPKCARQSGRGAFLITPEPRTSTTWVPGLKILSAFQCTPDHSSTL